MGAFFIYLYFMTIHITILPNSKAATIFEKMQNEKAEFRKRIFDKLAAGKQLSEADKAWSRERLSLPVKLN